jgi:hypothetical protein
MSFTRDKKGLLLAEEERLSGTWRGNWVWGFT